MDGGCGRIVHGSKRIEKREKMKSLDHALNVDNSRQLNERRILNERPRYANIRNKYAAFLSIAILAKLFLYYLDKTS